MSSSKLLSYVLESHPPAAIITHADLLPQLLELIYDGDRTGSHTIIVVGDPAPGAMASVASNIKVLNFAEVEMAGVRVEKIISPLPSKFLEAYSYNIIIEFVNIQIQVTYLPSRSSRLSLGMFKALS